MWGSRRFLLVLVLASVVCVVLVQIRVEDDSHAIGRLQYGENKPLQPHGFELSVSHFDPTTPKKQQMVEMTISSSSLLTTKVYPKKSVPTVNKTNHVISKAQIKHLPIGRKPSQQRSIQQYVNRQDRIQELMKQSSIVKKKPIPDPMRALKGIPVADPNTVKRIVLITYFRAGSTFVGDILQQNWKTFYHFEPLHSMTYDRRIEDGKTTEAFELFSDILNCNFSNPKSYFDWVKQPRNQFLFAHNLFLWVTCHGSHRHCYNASFVNSVCVRAPIHVMKVTRLHMRHLRSYLTNNTDLNLKVVYLTRDPRGIVSSRWSLDWCNGTKCSDAGVLCKDMDEDIGIFNELQYQHPENFIKVRYEDVSLNPESETQKLFQFLELPFSASVRKFLKTHTVGRKNDDKNPYSTRRNSTSMVFSWRDRFTYEQVQQVQFQCNDVLHNLNHTLITSPGQLPYPNGRTRAGKATELTASNRFHNNPLAKKYFAKTRTLNQTWNNMSLSNNHLSPRNSNNTNVEIHKSYKIVEINQK